MSFFGSIKKILKPAVDVPRWIGYQQLTQISRSLLTLGKSFFIPAQAQRQESFSEAMSRLQLTESDLVQQHKTFTRLLIVWLFVFIFGFIYAAYTVLQQAWLGAIPTLALSAAALAQAFRYHFWLFQLKQRKLGCSVNEWFTSSFKRRGQSL